MREKPVGKFIPYTIRVDYPDKKAYRHNTIFQTPDKSVEDLKEYLLNDIKTGLEIDRSVGWEIEKIRLVSINNTKIGIDIK